MHAFALVMTSCVSHPYFQARVAEAQRVVTYFRASHRPLALLDEEIDRLRIAGGGLQTSNKTRFTSVHNMLLSVVRCEHPLRLVAAQADAIPPRQQAIKDIINSSKFWMDLQLLCKLLLPFTQVIMAVQAREATLASLTLYWVYLARCLEAWEIDCPTTGAAGALARGSCVSWVHVCCNGCSTALLGASSEHVHSVRLSFAFTDPRFLLFLFAAGLSLHVARAFNTRAKEMDSSLNRLALFLDPRYKAAANSASHFKAMTLTVSSIASVCTAMPMWVLPASNKANGHSTLYPHILLSTFNAGCEDLESTWQWGSQLRPAGHAAACLRCWSWCLQHTLVTFSL